MSPQEARNEILETLKKHAIKIAALVEIYKDHPNTLYVVEVGKHGLFLGQAGESGLLVAPDRAKILDIEQANKIAPTVRNGNGEYGSVVSLKVALDADLTTTKDMIDRFEKMDVSSSCS